MANEWMSRISAIARKKLNAPDDFECFYFERVGETNDILTKGAVPRTLLRGPYKGEKTWKGCKPVLTCCITDAELSANI